MAGGWPGAGVWILPRHKPAMQICKRDAPELRPASIDKDRDRRTDTASRIMRAQANLARNFELNASATRSLAYKLIASRIRSKKLSQQPNQP